MTNTPYEIVVQKNEKRIEISSPGTQGPAGPGIENGSGPPSLNTGALGSFYIDTSNLIIYGPKTINGWGDGTNMVGPQGAQGDPGVATYIHVQENASTTWTITHNLGFYPNIEVVDSAGNAVIGNYQFTNLNTLIATFTDPFAGKAYLS
jgi:hypothetical protein